MSPFSPFSPFSPLGITKSKTAADVVPLLVTDAKIAPSPVVTLPTLIVAAVPASP